MKELLRLPGMIDAHVHLRDFEESHKEDWISGTSAALAGGVIGVLDMPNNNPSVVNFETLTAKRKRAQEAALCDFGFYLGATRENQTEAVRVNHLVLGLKMYLNVTHGTLLLGGREVILSHFESWTRRKPILVHAEGETVGRVIRLVRENPRSVHFCHISQKVEIEMVRQAKEMGLPVTCEVTPHHLFLTEEDENGLGVFSRMKPPLRTRRDVDALWTNLNLGVIDVIASDHAPHTREEKLSSNPPFGVPGLETTLPLLLTAVGQRKLTLEKLRQLTSTNPARIFGIRTAPGSFVEVDISQEWVVDEKNLKTKCGWSPFAGAKVSAKIHRVVIRGTKVFENGEILVRPGFGKELRYAGT